jgi:cobaltochelatase CobS
MYTGTQVQNSAMLDRFQTTLEIGYLSSAHEKKILKKKVKDLPASWINDMIKLAGLVRTAYNEGQTQYTMSPRTLISWGKKAVYWTSPIEGLRLAFMNKLVEEDKKLINDLVFKVYGQYA